MEWPEGRIPPRNEAIPELLARHGAQLYSLGRRLCGNRADAEDLVQETFLQAWCKWHQFDGRARPVTWLYTIAARLCRRMHRLRSGEPRRLAPFDEARSRTFAAARLGVVPGEGDGDGDGAGGLDAEVRREGRARIEAGILGLPVAYRLPLVLKEIVGLSVKEVADVLGLKESTVKVRLHRARLRLRDALDSALPQEELPPAAYPKQVCLDLLRAKQEALDHGTDLPDSDRILCERCRAVFATLDLTQDLCRELGEGEMPRELYDRLETVVGRSS